MPADDRHAAPSVVPLLRLRGHDREPVPPEACLLGPRCLVCRWRREGLLDRAEVGPPTGVNRRPGPDQPLGKSGVRGPLRLPCAPQKGP
ncbi:hypothetical protein BSZ37_07870 [Rubrivirga marina]|uniref:Uncharacterized protein n=2 Tax=Rubrivirga marina TaxID=1196024 RepID=A0A271IYM9_9BACT|nr:hypothetical protein BSZ37_07870 [Rubrivirga marina]